MKKISVFLALSLFGTACLFAQTALERRTVELINIERANHGLSPLIWHNTLASIARAHSEDMLRNNFVSAAGSDGSNAAQRIRQGGITNTIGGANSLVYGGADTPEQRVERWINSYPSTILHEERSHIGIGIVQRPAGSTANNSAYWTLLVINVPVQLSPSEMRAFEYRVFELTNIERANHGLPPLIWNDTLSGAARAHGDDLMRNDMRGHVGSDGSSARQRMERAGITNGRNFSENVSYNHRTPEAVVAEWMNSPGHRANILNENNTHLGVGLAQRQEGINSQYATYCVQKFCSFR